jgi:hypothetical protein
MPAYDGTGPQGHGSRTGGGRGRCATSVETDLQPGRGRGGRCGWGRGAGRGPGRGRAGIAAATDVSGQLLARLRSLETRLDALAPNEERQTPKPV